MARVHSLNSLGRKKGLYFTLVLVQSQEYESEVRRDLTNVCSRCCSDCSFFSVEMSQW